MREKKTQPACPDCNCINRVDCATHEHCKPDEGFDFVMNHCLRTPNNFKPWNSVKWQDKKCG